MIVTLIALFLGVLCSCGKKEQDLSGIISVPGDFLEAQTWKLPFPMFLCETLWIH